MAIQKVDTVWLKASILGCLWASSEIVIGSFLHNLRIPFTGNILTAIGIILMVSIGQIWAERGLFWRAGIICALMKSISPSAIIFGPMIAIFSEALIMEASTFLFRKRALSFLIGSALAMSWNLAQLVIGYIITYGSNIIYLYEKLSDYFQHQLGITSANYWWPVIIIAIFYLLAGLIAGGIGLYVGRQSKKASMSEQNKHEIIFPENVLGMGKKTEGTFSLTLLVCNLVLVVAALTVFNLKNIFISSTVVIAIVIFWILKYPNVLRPLKKPGFWIFLILTTTLSALLFNRFAIGKYDGWIIGAEMNLRATIMILGFAVIGRELKNPVISKWLFRSGFKQLPVALELAFDSLPAVISNIPGWKEITRKPISSFYTYVQIADLQLKEQEIRIQNYQKIIILTGEAGKGKTTFLKQIISALKADGCNISGIIAEAQFLNGIKTGYNLVNISSDEKKILIRTEEFPEAIKFRKYYFNNDVLNWGKTILDSITDFDSEIIVIDEIGPLELEEGGWYESLNKLTALAQYKMIWVVRKQILADVINKWDLKHPVIVDVSQTSFESAKEIILKNFSNT
jgi:nucleoside-triphosphatase THEP1